MTEAMPFLRKPILLSYDPRPCCAGRFAGCAANDFVYIKYILEDIDNDNYPCANIYQSVKWVSK